MPPPHPLAPALAALLTEVVDEDSLADVVRRYPALVELPTLTTLTEGVEAALAAPRQELHANLLLSHLLGLVSLYYNAHPDVTDGPAQVAFIDLLGRLRAAAVDLQQPDMADELSIGLGYAAITLGCFYSDHDDREGAIEAYTFALTHTPDDPLIYRNRALEHLARGDRPAAYADLEAAGRLEPESSALHRLWCEWLAADGDGPAMQPHVDFMLSAEPDDPVTWFYLALHRALDASGELRSPRPDFARSPRPDSADSALAAMRDCARRATPQQVAEGLATLDRLSHAHPAYRAALHALHRALAGQED